MLLLSPCREITYSSETSRHLLRRVSAKAVRTAIFCAQTVKRHSPRNERILGEILDRRLYTAASAPQGGPEAADQQDAQLREGLFLPRTPQCDEPLIIASIPHRAPLLLRA